MLNPQQQLTASAKKHIQWLPLYDQHVNIECAVLRRFPNNDILVVTIESLDEIDRKRLLNAFMRTNSHALELWEVLQSITMNNGINALEYFHQLAIMKTASGVIMKPQVGRASAGVAVSPKQSSVAQPIADTTKNTGTAQVAVEATVPSDAAPIASETVNTTVAASPEPVVPPAQKKSTYKPKTQK